MSLMKTLTKVAIGIVVAKGVQHMTRGGGPADPSPRRSESPARRPGAARTAAPDTSAMGGIMEEILSAGKTTTRRTGTGARATSAKGGLEEVLGSLAGAGTRRSRKTTPPGGLGDLLGGSGSGGLGGLLGAVLGGGALGGALGGAATGQTGATPDPEDEAQAAVLLRAMIMAAKADGKLDAQEKSALMEAVGDASRAEIDFINRELAGPVDLDGLLADVPRGMEEKVYLASLMAITLDEQAEADYLHALAEALGLSRAEVNVLHDQLNAPRIY